MFTRMTWLFHRVIVLQINTITQYYAMQILVLNAMQINKLQIKPNWFLVMTGQAVLMNPKGRNAERDGLVKLWKGAFIICNTIAL